MTDSGHRNAAYTAKMLSDLAKAMIDDLQMAWPGHGVAVRSPDSIAAP